MMRAAWAIAITAAASAGATMAPLNSIASSAVRSVAPQDEMRELKQSFEGRYRQIVRAKADGKVGETFAGFLAPLTEKFLEEDSGLAQLVRSENDDRERLYELLARDVKDEVDESSRERVTPEIVAERNARRNFRNAKDGEFLRGEDGVWLRKRDERAYEAIMDLKRAGSLREGDDGALSMDDGDANQRRAVDQENDRRRAMFDEIAKAANSDASAIAREHAKEHESRLEARQDNGR